MALIHDFVLLNKNEFSYEDCCELAGKISYDVSIDDDLILYFMDYLKWLPTYSPLLKIRMHGLDYHAMTIIDIQGATEALILFSSLVNILKLAPNVLKLTGAYTFMYADDDMIDPNEKVDRILKETAGYEKIMLYKSKVIQQFEILAELMRKVIDSNNTLYVLHFGV
ncbi:hypothetical protein HUN19_03790 [Acinetobacter oleivorans]|uniref:hypothetical protein n=1 Tax=Acinetobacter oleivorans TaxID=1148157 RepID=UPI00158092FE|nr:hypothetical protein [Acinetobacter oleivorans]NUF33095.1 hypothetical protein [Acinetobacter oleivorans]